MIHEMAAEDFPRDDDDGDGGEEMAMTGGNAATMGGNGVSSLGADLAVLDELDLQWIDPSHGPLGEMETEFDRSTATGLYTANFGLDYG
jgi:hypothetical protein